ncbi:MAG: FG-GAP-like repeat-containing protein [Ekhidna sp.]|uniref:FG-GAP-like repeat-containing protein n=1 Tax=Ekhidna sp. TaxID=2608089 RepID=UPI0032EEDF30
MYFKKVPILLVSLLAYSTISLGQFNEISGDLGLKHLAISFDLIGGGVAFIDYNNDGFDDIIVTGGAIQDKLFRNINGTHFIDVTERSGLNNINYFKTTGVSVGDINNDGFRDIFIGTEKRDACILYLNNGDDTFTNISQSAGISSKKWTIGSLFIDVNHDGLLDIYTINYIEEGKAEYDNDGNTIGFDHKCYPNDLYLNNGDNTFTLSTNDYGLGDTGCALAVSSYDINKDQLTDILIANDFGEWVEPNKAYINKHPSTSFEEISDQIGLNTQIYGMGIAIGDINGDGLSDIYITNLGKNVLLTQTIDGNYVNQTDTYGVGSEFEGEYLSTGWGSVFADLNNDGFEDLLVSNGFIPSASFIQTSEIDPNELYLNQSGESMIDASEEWNYTDSGISRGVAVSDFDNDGDLDVATTKLGKIIGDKGNMLFHENINAAGNWVKIRLKGTESNIDAIGARIELYISDRTHLREIRGGSSHASQNSITAHFGIGNFNGEIPLTVFWTGGGQQSFTLPQINQAYYIEQGNDNLYVIGCMDETADNYSTTATYNSGCIRYLMGCMDPRATNYNPKATIPGKCSYPSHIGGCTDPEAYNYNPFVTIDDGSCDYGTGFEFNNNLQVKLSQSHLELSSNNWDLATSTFDILSLDGKYIIQSSTTKEIIDVSNLKPGIYILRVIHFDRIFNFKFLLKN